MKSISSVTFMNSRFIKAIKYLLLFAIALVLLYFAFKGMDVKKIMRQIFHANMFWVSISGLLSIIAFVVRAQRWNLLIEPMGYTPSLKNTTYSVLVGYLANFLVPRLGEVSRCGALSKVENIPFNKLLGTVIVERIIDVISLIVCMLLTAFIEYKRLGNFFKEKMLKSVVEKFSQLIQSPLLLTLLALFLIAFIAGVIYFIRKNNSKGSESKTTKIIKGFIDGLKSVVNLERPGLFIFQSVFIWVLYYLSVYVALFAFPFTSNLGAGAALFLLVAGGIGMSAPVQGGIGAYHLLVSQGLVLYSISEQDGLAFATMLHGLQMLLVIVLGLISLLLLFRAKKPHYEKSAT